MPRATLEDAITDRLYLTREDAQAAAERMELWSVDKRIAGHDLPVLVADTVAVTTRPGRNGRRTSHEHDHNHERGWPSAGLAEAEVTANLAPSQHPRELEAIPSKGDTSGGSTPD
jgi:hypothetical protein